MGSFENNNLTFEKHTQVLRLNYSKEPKACWVLWPIFAWRVVAPVPKERKINLLQRAVLNLARAKVTAVAEIANHLLIATELAALIISELRSMSLLDFAGRPTEAGLQILDDIELQPPDEAQVGHVFTDAFNGKIWPRFLKGDLPFAKVESDKNGWPVLLSGSAGDPWKDEAFVVLPSECNNITMDRPTVREVLQAARRHWQQRHFDGLDDEHDVPRLQSVNFVDERPVPCLFALCVRRHESNDWMVEDPFGHGGSIDLADRLKGRLDTHNGLRERLERLPLLVSKATETPLGDLQAQAFAKVESRLTLAINQNHSIKEYLVSMQRSLLEAEMPEAPSDKRDDVLIKAQRAVELVLHSLYSNHDKIVHPPLFSKLAYSDKQFNRCLLDAIAAEFGFNTPLPLALSSIRRGKVQSAEQYGTGSLRSLVVLALLCADLDDKHPFRSTGRTAPDLLHRLDELATARNRAAHHSPDSLEIDTIQRHVETVYTAAETLLLNLKTDPHEQEK